MIELLVAAGINTEPLEEVIVTGNRLGQSRSEIAASVSTLDANQLPLTPSTAVDQILNQAPGVMLQNTNGQQHLTAIRSPVLTGGAGQGSFLYLEDGLPLRAAAFGNVNGLLESTWELADGIEVWRGPASAAYGANAVHGLVNVKHRRPQSNAIEFASSEHGQQLSAEALLGRGYAKAYINRDEGWRNSTGVDQEKLYLSVPISFNNFRIDNHLAVHRLDQQTAGFIRGADAYKDEARIFDNPNPDAYRKIDGLRWKSDLRFVDDALVISPYYRQLDSELLMHFLPSQAIENASQSSMGLLSNYQFSLSDIDVQLGVDLDFSEGELSEEQFIPDVFSYTQGVHYDYTVNTEQYAAFTQFGGQLSTQLSWEAGLRYETMNYDYRNHLAPSIEGRFLRQASRTDHYEVWLPKLALRYALDATQSVWGRLSRGGRTPQASDLYRLQINQTGGKAQVETLDNAEIGWLFDAQNVQAEVVVYYQKKNGFFFRDANGFSEASGKTDHRGIELDLHYQLAANWLWQASLSYSDHRYRFDRDISAGPNTTESIKNGNQVDTAPNWLSSQRVTWSPTEAWSLSARLDWVGRYYMDASNQHQYDGHQLLSFDLRYQPIESLSFGLNVHNLSDQRYADRADFAFGSERYLPGRPRTVSASVRYTF
ncbi:MAG: TonB-dependent receptor [Gammaproteobacteria bacterium]|nr:TonB-dependent receptor [Gammaproteobacteria bacterium]